MVFYIPIYLAPHGPCPRSPIGSLVNLLYRCSTVPPASLCTDLDAVPCRRQSGYRPVILPHSTRNHWGDGNQKSNSHVKALKIWENKYRAFTFYYAWLFHPSSSDKFQQHWPMSIATFTLHLTVSPSLQAHKLIYDSLFLLIVREQQIVDTSQLSRKFYSLT